MKYLLFSIACCFMLINSSIAQTTISTLGVAYYAWDNSSKDWKLSSSDDESMTFFEFNQEKTMFKHTTATMTSAYLIKSSEVDNEDGRDQIIFNIVSDVGNKYIMIIDIQNSNLRFMGTNKNNERFMVKHYIKKVFEE